MNDLETVVYQDADMESLNSNEEFAHRELDAEELETLKLERREIICEILKLNPSYKAPPDYVPLLKEVRVSLPIKDYPGYNFLGLIYGSGSDTLKRLEKVAITSDDKNNQDDYMELYTLISADTYDKVDAAVALVELLVTPVSASGSALPVSNAPILGLNSVVPTGKPNAVVAGLVQQVIRPTQVFQDQFQYNVPASVPNNTAQLLSSQTKPGDMASAVSTGPQTSEPCPYPSEPQQHMQFPMQAFVSDSNTFRPADPPRHTPAVAPHMFPSEPILPDLHQFCGSHVTPLGMSSLVRSLGTSWQQSAPDNPVGSQLNQDSSSTRWPIPSGPTQNSSMVGITCVPVLGHQNTALGMTETALFHSRPPTVSSGNNMNQGVLSNTSVAPPQVRSYLPLSQGHSAATIHTHPIANFAMQSQLIRGPVCAAPQNPAYRPGVVPMPGPSSLLPPINQSSLLPARPVAGMVPRMAFPNSGDFVFQSQQLQNSAASLNPWSGLRVQSHPPLEPTMQKPLDIRAPFVIPDFHNQSHRPFLGGYFRPHAVDQYDKFQPHFTERNPIDVFPRPTFPYEHFGMRGAAFSRMGDMGINQPDHQMANMHVSFISRPGNDFFPPACPGGNSIDNHPFSRQTFRPARGQQAYDPFSPTAASTVHQQQEASTNAKSKIRN